MIEYLTDLGHGLFLTLTTATILFSSWIILQGIWVTVRELYVRFTKMDYMLSQPFFRSDRTKEEKVDFINKWVIRTVKRNLTVMAVHGVILTGLVYLLCSIYS